MNTDIKQAMHVEAAKSLNAAEANENERRWNETKIDRKNEDPTNHYDKTRMKLNFEIGPDGKIYPLGYHPKSLDVRLQERLSELGWKPFKPDSKIQPNCCARFLFGGNHDRTLQMAFGSQIVIYVDVKKLSFGQRTFMIGVLVAMVGRILSDFRFIWMKLHLIFML